MKEIFEIIIGFIIGLTIGAGGLIIYLTIHEANKDFNFCRSNNMKLISYEDNNYCIDKNKKLHLLINKLRRLDK